MLEKQRHQLILDMLDERNFASVREMADQLQASEATIRRDIIKMSEQNLIKKIRGGAEAITQPGSNTNRPHLKGSAFFINKEKRKDVKRLIAKKAVELCEDGESIIINGGSSTFMMGEFLENKDLKILTNSFFLAHELISHSMNQITLPGGELYRNVGIILSLFENDTIQYYHATKMFMSAQGVGPYGVMESDPLLVRAEQKLRKQADKLVLLADGSKIGARGNLIFTPLSGVDVLITDSSANEATLKSIRDEGVEVIIADEE